MAQQQAIHKFTLGQKEVEGKQAEFCYDRGWYSIVELEGEERNTIYRSKNAQEAYMKWNVYIGRKKERPIPDDRRRNERSEVSESAGRKNRQENRKDRRERNDRKKDSFEGKEGRENRSRRRRDFRRDNRRREEEDE